MIIIDSTQLEERKRNGKQKPQEKQTKWQAERGDYKYDFVFYSN